MAEQPTRILVTGAGGPSAVSFLQSIAAEGATVWMGDIDPYAPGLYLVPPERRELLGRGDDPDFADRILELCRREAIDLVVPTVDSELLPLAERREEFAEAGVSFLLAPLEVAVSQTFRPRCLASSDRSLALSLRLTERSLRCRLATDRQ